MPISYKCALAINIQQVQPVDKSLWEKRCGRADLEEHHNTVAPGEVQDPAQLQGGDYGPTVGVPNAQRRGPEQHILDQVVPNVANLKAMSAGGLRNISPNILCGISSSPLSGISSGGLPSISSGNLVALASQFYLEFSLKSTWHGF